jgi:YD repeat-containing protein
MSHGGLVAQVGHDRLTHTYFPLAARGSNASNAMDFEELGYDSAGNVTSLRNRAGQTIGYTFDALNRMTFKDMPNAFLGDHDLAFEYDLLGRLVRARNFESWWGPNGYYFSLAYDALGRLVGQTSHHGVMSWQYDLAGRRTRLTHNDGSYHVDYDHLVTGEVWRVRENGATSGVGVIATYGYDVRGRRASLTRGNGTVAGYQYDPASSLLSQITEDMAGSAHDFTLTFAYNPAGQIVSSTRSNDLYSFAGQSTATTDTPPNGLNQISQRDGTTFSYDANGNLASDGARSYLYAADNRLAQANGNWLGADPLGRFNHSWYNNDGFDYDGHNLIVHRSGSTGPAYERFVHGPGADEPLMAVAADGSNRRFLHADERGSIVAMSDSSGNVVAVNRYDEYGVPASGNSGFSQYAGQPWLAGDRSLARRELRSTLEGLPREMGLDGAAHAFGDLGLTFGRVDVGDVDGVGEIAALEQDRGDVRGLEHDEAGEAVPFGAERKDRCRLAIEDSGEIGRHVHALALGEIDQDDVDAGVRAEAHAADQVRLVLALGEQGRVAVRGDLREGVDGGAAGAVIVGGRVCVDRDEQVGLEPARDLVAVLEQQVAVVVASEGDADPAGGGERVADPAGEGEGYVLLDEAAIRRARARIATAMARIDDHERRVLAARCGRARQNEIGAAGLDRLDRNVDPAPAGRGGGAARQPAPGDQARDQRQHIGHRRICAAAGARAQAKNG